MAKLLDFMIRCNNASEDDISEDLIRMADPNSFDSRDEMESHFESCLGYNPMEYFDRKTIDEQFDEILNDAPYSVQNQLRDKREEIIDRTLECSDDIGDTVLRKVFVGVIKDTIGWQPVEDADVSLDECISMAIFGEGIEDSDDYDTDDEEDEDIDDEIFVDDEDFDDLGDDD